MNLKSFFSILSFAALVLSSMSMVAQDRPRPAAATSLSGNSLSRPVADIDTIREASKHTFSVLDANSSGSITLDEIDIVEELIEGEESLPAEKLAELRQRSNVISRTFMRVEEEIDHFEVADTDLDGTLSEDEFNQREATVRTHILKLNLDSFDKDKNGGVELGEFTAHLDNVEELDTDGDGNLSRTELREVTDQRLLHDVRVSYRQRQENAEEQARRRAIQSESDERNNKNSR